MSKWRTRDEEKKSEKRAISQQNQSEIPLFLNVVSISCYYYYFVSSYFSIKIRIRDSIRIYACMYKHTHTPTNLHWIFISFCHTSQFTSNKYDAIFINGKEHLLFVLHLFIMFEDFRSLTKLYYIFCCRCCCIHSFSGNERKVTVRRKRIIFYSMNIRRICQ